MPRIHSDRQFDHAAADAAWEKYETSAEPDPYDEVIPELLIDLGDIPLVGELAGRYFILNGRFRKNRRRSTKLVYPGDDRRGHSAYARELVKMSKWPPADRHTVDVDPDSVPPN